MQQREKTLKTCPDIWILTDSLAIKVDQISDQKVLVTLTLVYFIFAILIQDIKLTQMLDVTFRVIMFDRQHEQVNTSFTKTKVLAEHSEV